MRVTVQKNTRTEVLGDSRTKRARARGQREQKALQYEWRGW